MSNQLALGLISLIVAIDNALFAGMVLSWTSGKHKKETMIVVGSALSIYQILATIGVGQLLSNVTFRILVILVLIWMSIRALMIPSTSRSNSNISVIWKVFMYTALGNLDNVIWLGSELKGQYFWFISFSLITIPLFIITSLFLSDQFERHHWIRILGSGMMAWAAGGLILETPGWKITSNNTIFPFPQLIITLFIVMMAFFVNLLVIRRQSHQRHL
ncbi:hypothetical protein [Alicyclobacillus shizuokensis]|uniref:hypothetical protein n=1 Tax=Alicyclobacillus shizuokensis TaxID=392014 RepID=UPI00083545EC|nr:hypothetical protein [Alicyclobacillus shizuokensis]MCL6625070.1 hypothetical protein [Alicyclobacillus shizuokensis]